MYQGLQRFSILLTFLERVFLIDSLAKFRTCIDLISLAQLEQYFVLLLLILIGVLQAEHCLTLG